MGYGIECYDANGRLTFATGDHLARIIGTVYTNRDDGYVAVPEFNNGGGFAMYLPETASGNFAIRAAVVIEYGGFRWSWPTWPIQWGSQADRMPGTIIYGVIK